MPIDFFTARGYNKGEGKFIYSESFLLRAAHGYGAGPMGVAGNGGASRFGKEQ